MRSTTKIALAVLAFAGLHSILASRAAKERAAHLLGERNRNGLYRFAFNPINRAIGLIDRAQSSTLS